MKNIILSFVKPVTLFSAFLIIMVTSCKQDEYYIDGGKSNPVFNGNMLQYLNSNAKFDTIAQIIKLAEMEDVFKKEKITFFCPTDEVVRRTIGNVRTGGLNALLFGYGKDTIKTLSDVDPTIWRKYLSRYIYKGSYTLKDYPQLDFTLKPVYPGAFYYSLNNDLANIGVVFNSVNGVKYTGYRQLTISFLPDPSSPNRFIPAAVATSDIQPSNGVVHVLAIAVGTNIGEVLTSTEANLFGFNFEFMLEVVLSK